MRIANVGVLERKEGDFETHSGSGFQIVSVFQWLTNCRPIDDNLFGVAKHTPMKFSQNSEKSTFDTGVLKLRQEEVEVFLISVGRKKRQDFVLLHPQGLKYAVNANLTALGFRLWLALVGLIDIDNRVRCNVVSLAEILHVNRTSVYPALRQLAQSELLIVTPRSSSLCVLNPWIVSRCTLAQEAVLRKEWDEMWQNFNKDDS